MKTVKTFDNLAEAGFASSLLESEGIPASLADEGSFQLVAGMQVQGIRLQVEDQDYERAQRILERKPDASGAPASPEASAVPAVPSAPTDTGKIPVGLFVAFAVGLAFLGFAVQQYWHSRHAAARPEVQTYSYDDNHDGTPDHFYTYRRGILWKEELDRNFDGKIDAWGFYDKTGMPERWEEDNNFDGKPDLWLFYKNGSLVRVESDTDFNGQPDVFTFLENRVRIRTDVRPNGSKTILRQYRYEHGVLREELVDDRGDGQFHYKILYDPFGGVSEHIPLPPK